MPRVPGPGWLLVGLLCAACQGPPLQGTSPALPARPPAASSRGAAASPPPAGASASPPPAGAPAEASSLFQGERERRIREALARWGQGGPGRVGWVYHDLERARGLHHQELASFEAASLAKLPILVELARRAGSGELSLDEEIPLEERHRAGGSGSLRSEPAGTRWSLDELARRMISESDNTASDMLFERLGGRTVEPRLRSLGLTATTLRRRMLDFEAIDRGEDNLTTPLDMSRLLRGLAEGRWPLSSYCLELLGAQRRRDMLPARLPPGTRVAHKTGELLGVLHDVGIITDAHGRYLLILMAQGFADRGQAVARWAALSEAVWQARNPEAPRRDP